MKFRQYKKCLSVILAIAIVIYPSLGMVRSCYAQQVVQSKASYEREAIHQELLQQNKLLKALLLAQSAKSMTDEQRKETARTMAVDVKAKFDNFKEMELTSEKAKALRAKIAGSIQGFVDNPIDATTNQATVQSLVTSYKGAQRDLIAARDAAQKQYWDLKEKLPRDVQATIKSNVRVHLSGLEQLGKDKLAEVMQKVDPALDKAKLALKDAKQLAELFSTYANDDNSWSAEQIAVLGAEGLKQVTGTALPPELAGQFVAAANEAAETQQLGAAYVQLATTIINTAIATGNPYVIAAAVAIVVILAVLQMIFGGDGGGEGDGDSQGEGDGTGKEKAETPRNGAGAPTPPSRPSEPSDELTPPVTGGPQGTAPPPGSNIVIGSEVGDFALATKEVGTDMFLIVFKISDKSEALKIDESKVRFLVGTEYKRDFDVDKIGKSESFDPTNQRLSFTYTFAGEGPVSVRLTKDAESDLWTLVRN